MASAMEIAMKDLGVLIELANANLKVLAGPYFNVQGYGAVCDGVTDDSTKVQLALDAALAEGGGTVFIPFNCYYLDASISNGKNVTIVDYSNGQFVRTITNGFNVGGAVNEMYMQAPFHPAMIVKVQPYKITDPLGVDQVPSYRASYLIQAEDADGNLIDLMQISSDILAEFGKDITDYCPDTSKRWITRHNNGRMTYGQNSSALFTSGEFYHSFYGNAAVITDGVNAPNLTWMNEAGTIRRRTSVDSLNNWILLNHAENVLSVVISDEGQGKFAKGINGGVYTTTQRNTAGFALNMNQGSSVYDSTLGKPIWLHTPNGAGVPVWHDAAGSAI